MHAIPPDAYLIIIGAMKCGTTSLFDQLAMHPMICPCNSKEPEFFSKAEPADFSQQRYGALWDFEPLQHRYALEASTGYSKHPHYGEVAKRMRASGIRPKLIYLLRDPIQRIESHIAHARLAGHLPSEQINDLNDIGHYLLYSRYHQQLQPYADLAAAGRLHLLTLEELQADPAASMTDLWDFLDLPACHASIRHSNPRTQPSRLELAARKLPGLRSGLQKILPLEWRATLRQSLQKLAPAPPLPPLSPCLRRQAKAALQDDMLALHRDYGVDIERWGFQV